MAAPTITTLPTAPSRSDPANFNTRAEAMIVAIADMVAELNSYGTYLNSNTLIGYEFGFGTAAAPSINFGGDRDDDTGFYRVSANVMGIVTGGVERARVTNTGQLAIGTDAPQAVLHVTSAAPSMALEESDAGTDEKIWRWRCVAGVLRLESVLDDGTTGQTIYQVDRTGAAEDPQQHRWYTGTTEKMRLDVGGNLLIGTGTAAASATSALHISNGVAPTGSITNGVVLYSEDVTASAELKVRDEAGNVTTLSPHNFDLIGAPSEPMAWSYYSQRDGQAINVDMLRAIRLLEQLSGEQLVTIREV